MTAPKPVPVVSTERSAHKAHADSTTDLVVQPWGERAFHAVLLGYRFLIAAESQSQ